MTLTRVAALGLAALAGYAAVLVTIPAQASAATAYRYWAYYVAHGTSWQYSQRGPATEYPVDGEVQGWRFAVQADAGNGLLPRSTTAFATLCPSTPTKAGELRVAVVVDFGTATDAPAHEHPPAGVLTGCVYVPDGATGADVLVAAAAVRIGTGSDVGLVCGIDGYPKTECAVAVTTHPVTPTLTPTLTRTAIPTPMPTPVLTHPASAPATLPAPSPSAAPNPSAAPTPTAAPTPSAATSAPLASKLSVAASPAASALSLAALRSSTGHGSVGVHAATIGGIALIVVVGAGAVWRTRARGR